MFCSVVEAGSRLQPLHASTNFVGWQGDPHENPIPVAVRDGTNVTIVWFYRPFRLALLGELGKIFVSAGTREDFGVRYHFRLQCPIERGQNILRRDRGHLNERLAGDTSAVWAQYDVRECEQRVIDVWWL